MLIRPAWLCGLVVAAGTVITAIDVEAQYYNPTQQGQGTPRTNTGSSSSSSMFGGSGAGASGSSAFGIPATGQQGLGQIGFGNTGQTGMNQGRNTTGGAQGQNGFLGVNNNPNSFLGRNTQGQQAGQNQGGQRNNRGGGQRGMDQELQNLLNGNGQFGGNNANASKNTGVRPRQKVAFEHPTLQAPGIVSGLNDRFGKLAVRFPHLKNVDLSVAEDGAIVLRGEVESEHHAKLTESLVRLEPGVKSIRSELTFPPPAAAQ